MKTLFKSALLAGLALAALSPQTALAARNQPAAPASANGTVVPGVGVANIEAIVANSDAVRAATQQRPVTYKPQLDAFEARRQQVTTQLQPLVDKFQRDRAAPNANTPAAQASLGQQAAAIQQIQENAQNELNQMLQPVVYSEAYVTEQVEDKLDTAVKNAMRKRGITLLLSPQAVVATENSYNLNQDILTELNLLIPTAQLVPPEGWEPRQIREARAAQNPQAAAPGAAPAAPATPAGPQTDGR